MQPFEPCCLATGIGSLPHKESAEACELILKNLKDIPFWPQLPARSLWENMYYQFAEHIPGIKDQSGKLVIDTGPGFEERVTEFYEKYLKAAETGFPLLKERAAGFFAFLEASERVKTGPSARRFFGVKAQVTGPISYGLSIQDENVRPVLYNEMAMDCVCKNISLIARWQEDALIGLGTHTIMFIDEPSMATYGSAFFNYGADLVSHYLEIATEGLRSLIAIHCCANTDWGLLMQSPATILSFDAYGYQDRLLLYTDQLGDFLQRGGALGVGIVPAQWEYLRHESVESLAARLDGFFEALAKRGIDRELAIRRTLLTPSCGLGSQSVEGAESAIELTSSLSREARKRYSLIGKESI